MAKDVSSSVQLLQLWISECPSQGLVFFGGAGVSTESGIPDFRSADGLYAMNQTIPPETIISNSFFMKHPDMFYEFYCDHMIYRDAQPNAAHLKLSEFELSGTMNSIITQNIDGLHQAAGSRRVHELHGSVLRNYCMKCSRFYGLDELLEARDKQKDGIPRCSCGGIIKPDVVLYEEPLDDNTVLASVRAIQSASMLIIAGTSLAVYPAAGLIDYFNGDHLVIINRDPTPRDKYADLCIKANIGDVLGFLQCL